VNQNRGGVKRIPPHQSEINAKYWDWALLGISSVTMEVLEHSLQHRREPKYLLLREAGQEAGRLMRDESTSFLG
jgi:hypothetical protein